MSETVHVCYLVNGNTVDESHTAERISLQLWGSGRAIVRLHNEGRRTAAVAYRRAERIHRTIETAEAT